VAGASALPGSPILSNVHRPAGPVRRQTPPEGTPEGDDDVRGFRRFGQGAANRLGDGTGLARRGPCIFQRPMIPAAFDKEAVLRRSHGVPPILYSH
jgi:hypothetical protein